MIKCKNPNFIRLVTDPEHPWKKKALFFAGRGKLGFEMTSDQFKEATNGLIEVPCGNCAACRLEYSRVWANRCYLESLDYPNMTWFVTLSYRDDALVYNEGANFATLENDAISDFMRKLRDYFGHDIKIRYFGCGEYGDRTMRPHYHIIVFGAPLNDLTIDMPDMSKPLLKSGKYPIFRRKNSNGDYVFFSQAIYDCWQKGKIEVENASWNTAAYVSRYVMKKQKGTAKEIYDRLKILPEYLRMSNRPGIGARWLEANKTKLLRNDYMSVKNKNGVQTTRPPRYFEKLMMKDPESLDAALMESNKISRIINSNKRYQEILSTKPIQVLADCDAEFYEKKSRVLKRDIT